MKTYLIAYDLLKPGQDYQDLYGAIKGLGTWAHPEQSLWLVNSNASTVGIRDYLLQYMDGNDKLIVFPVGSDWAGQNLGQDVYAWLKQNWMPDRAYA
jgi:hypothetical protein